MSDAPAKPAPIEPPKQNRRNKPPGAKNEESKPYRKATNDEIEQRVNEVMVMLGNAYTKIDIHNAFRRLNENIQKQTVPTDPKYRMYDLHWRSVDRYIALARKEMLKRSGRRKSDVFADSVAYWESVIRSQKNSTSDKNFARKRIDDLFGLYAPKQVRVTTPVGQPIQVTDATPGRPLIDVPIERLREIAMGALDVEAEVTNGKTKEKP